MTQTPDTADVFRAVENGDFTALQQALAAGFNLDTRDENGNTLLHRACFWYGKTGYTMVQLLLQAGADVHARNQEGQTPLATYVETTAYADEDEELTDIADLLLRHGAEVNVRYAEGRTPLHEAAHTGTCAMVQWLLQAGADVNAADEEGETPLLLASYGCGDYQKIGLLLRAGAAPNIRCTRDSGATALDRVTDDMVVFPQDHGERTVYLLRRFGAREGYYMEANAPADTPESPTKLLLRAVDNNDKAALLHQLAAGADINAYGDTFFGAYTALMKAARFGLPDIVRLLLEHGADATLRDSDKDTALAHAVEGDNEECIRLLLAAGLNPHEEETSLLHLAANDGCVHAVMALLRHTDLDPTAKRNGKTPREEAEQFFCDENIDSGYGDIIVLLQRAEQNHAHESQTPLP